MATNGRRVGGLLAAATVALWLAVGCGPTTGGNDLDAGGVCTTADEPHCEGPNWLSCEGGQWKAELCAQPQICAAGLGCRTCKPNEGYCSSQDAYVCAADGMSWEFRETCRPEQQCISGGCLSACDQAQTSRSNVGCEFWAVDLPSDYQCQTINGGPCDGFTYGCAACQQFAVVVANTSDFTVSIKVEQNNAPAGQPAELATVAETSAGPKGLQVLNLPQREVDCTEYYTDAQGRQRRTRESTTCLTSRAYRVTTTYPVVAYQFNPIVNAYSNGASLLIPTNGLDNAYYVMGWYTSNPIAMPMPSVKIEGIPDFMYVTVVGVMDNTNIQIETTQATQEGADGGAPVAAAEIGGTINATLGPFDVLAVASRAPKSLLEASKQGGDFTGTRVTADKPIVVFSSGQRSMAPDDPDSYSPPAPRPADYDLCCTEHFEQQMFPISSLGKQFVVTRTPPRQIGTSPTQWEPDFYRVLATKPGTTITTNLPDFPTMTIANAGEYAKLWSQQDFVLESNEPVMIAQFAVAEMYLENYDVGGDPEFILFPPAEQHRMEYVFLTPETFDKDYVIIAAPDGTQVFLDGEDVNIELSPLCDRYPAGTLNNKTYNALRCPVADGPHTVTATEPVGISVYGYYSVGSYGYPGGADVRQINLQ